MSLKNAKDKDAFREKRLAFNKEYYSKYEKPKKRWTMHDIDLIMKHEQSDVQLSEITGHGVRAIQIMRSKLKSQEK